MIPAKWVETKWKKNILVYSFCSQRKLCWRCRSILFCLSVPLFQQSGLCTLLCFLVISPGVFPDVSILLSLRMKWTMLGKFLPYRRKKTSPNQNRFGKKNMPSPINHYGHMETKKFTNLEKGNSTQVPFPFSKNRGHYITNPNNAVLKGKSFKFTIHL